MDYFVFINSRSLLPILEKHIREATPSDLPLISVCHQRAFPKSLSSALGVRYLSKMFSWYLSSPKTFLFHSQEDGKCLGYCGAMVVDGSWPVGSTSSVVRYSFTAGVWAIVFRPWLLFNWEIWEKWPLFWNNLKFKLGVLKKNNPPHAAVHEPFESSVGLIVIGVHPDYQGKGYGAMLLQEFERRAVVDFGIRKFHLSVRIDNTHAIQVYEHAGWKKGQQQGGSVLMWKHLPPAQ